MSTLSDQAAVLIAKDAYERKSSAVIVDHHDEIITYNVIETIEDKLTGLHGYVLKNDQTNEIVISFEGTQKDIGWTQAIRDLNEDIVGVLLGSSEYTEKENKPVKYTGLPMQKVYVGSGFAKIEDNKFFLLKRNQFTEADIVVKKQIEKYGAQNITFVGHSLGGGLAEYFAITYNSHAVTFSAPDITNLLNKEQKSQVKNGDFKHSIISYAHPDDLVSSSFNKPVGSTYFLMHPSEVGFMKNLKKHGIANYNDQAFFDKDGYYLPGVLIDGTLHGKLGVSPLALKNSEVENYTIQIKAAIMNGFIADVEQNTTQHNTTRIENTERSLLQFWDFYIEEMKALKSKYNWMVGVGQYDLLSSVDVQEVFASIGQEEEGVPLIFNISNYEEMLIKARLVLTDTEDIAFHMYEMNEDLQEADTLIAQWLKN